jgi:hypothetical protein
MAEFDQVFHLMLTPSTFAEDTGKGHGSDVPYIL